MERHLYLLRHALAEPVSHGEDDFARALTEQGEQQAARMGRWLWERDDPPERILSSPARRTRQTAARVCHAMAIPREQITWVELIYSAHYFDLCALLSQQPHDLRVLLLIGHNPALEELVDWLTASEGSGSAATRLSPASLASLTLPLAWSELAYGVATLEQVIHVEALPDEQR
ncbi:MAG: phosphohistidine phosphatase SixA [Halothiobacillaceae bacterium]|nr:MAG: phosphohistidine phosphatase SixA [Halothiobacillaceae bacterium]